MLEVESIDTFYGDAQILHGVSLRAPAGSVVALLGRNGAGKTTTLKSIMGLVRPRRGRIRFEGADLVGLAPHTICRMGIGWVPEDRRIFRQLTVLENLAVARRPAPPGTEPWTPDRLFALFPNLSERRRTEGGKLSGGEQQMLTITRTLMGNPRLLLLDEPTEGLAPVLVDEIVRTIAALKANGLTVVLSEQNVSFARGLADHAVIIEGGSVRWEGTPDALERQPAVRDRYLALA